MDGTRVAQWILTFLAFIFMVICLGLSGAIIEQQTSHGSPVRINYSMFASVFGLLCLLFYVLPSLFFHKMRSVLFSLIIDFLNWVFFLSGGIALAARMQGKNCGDTDFLRHNPITNGGEPGWEHKFGRRCREAGALTGFMWFSAAAWFGLWLCAFVEHKRVKGDSERRRVDMRGSTMRQI